MLSKKNQDSLFRHQAKPLWTGKLPRRSDLVSCNTPAPAHPPVYRRVVQSRVFTLRVRRAQAHAQASKSDNTTCMASPVNTMHGPASSFAVREARLARCISMIPCLARGSSRTIDVWSLRGTFCMIERAQVVLGCKRHQAALRDTMRRQHRKFVCVRARARVYVCARARV